MSDGTAGQMDGEASWWTTSGKIGLPLLARVMGVGRQQHHHRCDGTATRMTEKQAGRPQAGRCTPHEEGLRDWVDNNNTAGMTELLAR